MARGISVDFSLNPKDFLSALKKIVLGTEDVIDALGDLGGADVSLDTGKAEKDLDGLGDAAGDAERSLDDLSGTDVDVDTRSAERGLGDVEDAAGDAEDAFGDLSREAKSELGKVEDAATDAGDEIKSELKDGTGDAEKAFAGLGSAAKSEFAKVETAAQGAAREVGEVEDETAASAKEFGASFRGDPVEALEEVQSLVSELANKLIPGIGGAVASIAGGIAFGALIAFYNKWREEQEARTEQVREWRDAILGAFADARDGLDREEVLGGLKDQLDKAGVDWTDFMDSITRSGPEIESAFAKAFRTTDPEDMAAAIDLANAALDEFGYTSGSDLPPNLQVTYDALKTVTDGAGSYGDSLLAAGDQADSYNAVLEDSATAAERVAQAHRDAADAVRELDDEFATADEAVDTYQATLDDTAAAVEKLTADGQPLVGGLDNTTEAGREAKDTLRGLAADALDAAAAQVELDGDTKGAVKTTREARQAFIDAGIEMGLSRKQARQYADQLGLIPGEVRTTATISVDRVALDKALSDARAGVELPVEIRVKNQNAIQAAIGGSLAGNQSGVPR